MSDSCGLSETPAPGHPRAKPSTIRCSGLSGPRSVRESRPEWQRPVRGDCKQNEAAHDCCRSGVELSAVPSRREFGTPGYRIFVRTYGRQYQCRSNPAGAGRESALRTRTDRREWTGTGCVGTSAVRGVVALFDACPVDATGSRRPGRCATGGLNPVDVDGFRRRSPRQRRI